MLVVMWVCEVMLMVVLLVVFGSVGIMYVVGFFMVLGVFLVGVLLVELSFCYILEVDIEFF